MHKVGPFREYDQYSSEDRIKAVGEYMRKVMRKPEVTYRECVQFIAANQGNVNFTVDAINYKQACDDFLDYLAPHLMVFLDFHGLGSSIIAEDVWKVGEAWSTMKLKEVKRKDLQELYALNPNPSPDQIADVLREGDPLRAITSKFKIKAEDVIFFSIEGVDKNNHEHDKIRQFLDRTACYVNEDRGNYVVKILPTTSHVDMMMFANSIYSSF